LRGGHDSNDGGTNEGHARARLRSVYLGGSPRLLLKDKTGYLPIDYWLEGSRLHCLNLDGEHKVRPLGKLELNEPVRFNREPNVEIVLRSREDG
jgi:hypothetical protein